MRSMLNKGPEAAQAAAIAFEKKYSAEDFQRFGHLLKLDEPQRAEALAKLSEADRNLYSAYVSDAYEVELIFSKFIKEVKTDNTLKKAHSQQQVVQPQTIQTRVEPQEWDSDSDKDSGIEVHSDPVVRRNKFNQ